MDKKVRKLYENKIFSGTMIVLFLGVTGFFIYQTTQIEVGLNAEDVVPDDSFVLDFSELKKKYFPSLLPNVYIILPKLDYYKADVRV